MQVQLPFIQPVPAVGLAIEEIFARVWRDLAPATGVPEIRCLVRPYVNTMGKIAWRDTLLEVRLSDLVAGSPGAVREALARILLGKLLRRPAAPHWVAHYRRWMNRNEVRRALHLVKSARGRKYISGPRGEHYDLDPLFDILNAGYFNGLMTKPQLGWSRRPSRTLLGHYDPSHNSIVLSRLLDSPDVPPVVVEYVMFHEMLHLAHPAEHKGSRRCVHTKEFRNAEKQYPRLAEAKAAIRGL